MLPPKLVQGGDPQLNWRAINALIEHAAALERRLAALDRRAPLLDLPDLHPFRLYHLPDHLRPAKSDDDWRRLRVRAGRLLHPALTLDVTDGTDAQPPDRELYGGPESDPDILVPADTSTYHFYLEWDLTAATARVRHSTDPAADALWPAFPAPDEAHLLLASADTASRADRREVIVRQFVRADVVLWHEDPRWS